MLPSITTILQKSFETYRDHWHTLIRFASLIFLPIVITIAMSIWVTLYGLGPEGFPIAPLWVLVTASVVSFIATIANIWLAVPLTRALAAAYTGQPVGTIQEEIRQAVPKVLPLVVVGLLTLAAIVGGLILLIIPAIIFGVWFSFANLAVILSDKGAVAAMKYSKSLVVGRWWEIFVKLLVPAVVIGIGMNLVLFIIGLPAEIFEHAAIQSINGLLIAVATVALTPLAALPALILFIEAEKSLTPMATEPNVESNPPEPTME